MGVKLDQMIEVHWHLFGNELEYEDSPVNTSLSVNKYPVVINPILPVLLTSLGTQN